MKPTSVSRRGFFAGVGLAGAATVLASCSEEDRSEDSSDAGNIAAVDPDKPILFDGKHQAGIHTPPQSTGILIAYDMTREGKQDLRKNLKRLLRIWTEDARIMCEGGNPLADLEPEMNQESARLSITFGIGPRLLRDLGLEKSKEVPGWVKRYVDGIPAFSADKLQDEWNGGDLILQICGDQATSAAHAARHLTRAGSSYCKPRWTQRGFLDSPQGETPRNLLGFKDGTAQPRDEQDWQEAIWDEFGGSAMVVRRVVFDIPSWEELSRGDRELAFGRDMKTGAPLGGTDEFEDVDLSKTDSTGLPYIDPKSHVGIAAGQGTNMRRRAYNWDNDVTVGAESGLIFIAFQRDPDEAFTPLQKKLSDNDRMNTWMTHIGSAIFWVLPGTTEDSHWGESLLTE